MYLQQIKSSYIYKSTKYLLAHNPLVPYISTKHIPPQIPNLEHMKKMNVKEVIYIVSILSLNSINFLCHN